MSTREASRQRQPEVAVNASEGQRCALVTGSSNGIGEAIVKALARQDYKLVVTGRNAQDIARVANECAKLSKRGQKPLEVLANLENEVDVESLFESSMKHFDNKLHLLVNNAGIGLPVPHTKPKECWLAYKRVLEVNLNSAVHLSLLAAEPLKQTAQLARDNCAGESWATTTSIVNIGSIAGLRPSMSLFSYGVSKAGLAMLSSSLAAELGPLVRVNCVSPGPIETNIIERAGFNLDNFKQFARSQSPSGTIGRSEDVAHCVMFLSDPQKAAYITGANLNIDGGRIIAPMRWIDEQERK